jgi:hypothetical protein
MSEREFLLKNSARRAFPSFVSMKALSGDEEDRGKE